MLVDNARRVETAAKDLLTQVDDSSASVAELRDMLAVSKRAAAILSLAQANAAAAIAGRERHGDGGTQVLADGAGLTQRDARTQIKTVRAVTAAPGLRDAVESGRVSLANAKRLADAAERTSPAEVASDGELLAKAASMRPERFSVEARRWAAERQGDNGTSEHARQRARRYLRVWDGDHGMVCLHGQLDKVTGTRVRNRLETEARRMLAIDKKHAGDPQQRRSFDQCMADAVANLTANPPTRPSATGATSTTASDNPANRATTSTTASDNPANRATTSTTASDNPANRAATSTTASDNPANRAATSTTASDNPANRAATSTTASDNPANRAATKGGDCANPDNAAGGARPFADICVVAHVDNDTGELIAELADGTRLPKAVLEELACNARFTGVVYDHKGKPIWRTEAQRSATEAQRRILLDRWGGCFHCGANPGLCQLHHIKPVSEGGETRLDNLVPGCWDCHHRIHYDHWWILKSPDGWHTLHPPQRVHHGPAHAPDHPTPAPLFEPSAQTAPKPPEPASPTLLTGESQPEPQTAPDPLDRRKLHNRQTRTPKPRPTRQHQPRQSLHMDSPNRGSLATRHHQLRVPPQTRQPPSLDRKPLGPRCNEPAQHAPAHKTRPQPAGHRPTRVRRRRGHPTHEASRSSPPSRRTTSKPPRADLVIASETPPEPC